MKLTMFSKRLTALLLGGALAIALLLTPAAPPARAQDGDPADPVDQLLGEDEEEQAAPEQVEVEPTADDDAIEERLQSILDSTGWFRETLVDVRDGVVFLSGNTTSDRRRTWAGDLARSTRDVVAVVNNIEVVPPSALAIAQEELQQIWRGTLRALPIILLGLAVLVVAWYVARGVFRLARWLFRDSIRSPLLRDVIARVVAVPAFLLGLYLVLQVAGLTRLALGVVGGTGVVGIVVGFAFRDIAENFLASLLISMRNPFRADDLIEVAGFTGIVRQVTTRSTILMTLDGNHVQIPNATIFKSTITNFTANPNRRGDFRVGIGYDAEVAEAQATVAGVLADYPAVLERPEPLVLVEEMGASTINVRVYYWFNGHDVDHRKIKSALIRLTKRALEAGGFSMPDEAREVIFPQGVPILTADSTTSEATRSGVSSNGTTGPDGEAAPRPSAIAEGPTPLTSAAEGDLRSGEDELREQARQSPTPEEGADLLEQN